MVGGTFCDKCGKDIEVEKGFYHCGGCKEDYHKECSNHLKIAPPEKTEKVLHPLNGKKIIITDAGCIDFEQHCTLLVFCNKLGAQ